MVIGAGLTPMTDLARITNSRWRALNKLFYETNLGSPLLTLITIFDRLRRSMLNCFNSSRVGPELVPIFGNEQVCLYLFYFSCYLPDRWRLKLASALQVSQLHLL